MDKHESQLKSPHKRPQSRYEGIELGKYAVCVGFVHSGFSQVTLTLKDTAMRT